MKMSNAQNKEKQEKKGIIKKENKKAIYFLPYFICLMK